MPPHRGAPSVSPLAVRRLHGPLRLRGLLCALLLWTRLLGPTGAGAAVEDGATIRVRARAELRLRETGRQVLPGGRRSDVTVALRLSDPAAGEPLSNQRVEVVVRVPEGRPVDVPTPMTGADGEASLTLSALPPGRYQLTARYAGDDLRDPAEATLSIDLSRNGARLALSIPARVALGEELRVVVDLAVGDGTAPLPGAVDLFVGERRIDDLHMRDGHGVAQVPVTRDLTRPPLRGGAALAVRARYAGNDFYGEAADARAVLVTTQAQVTLEAPAEAHQGGTVALRGVARDEDGPIPGAAIDIEATPEATEGTPRALALGTGVTGADGAYRVRLSRLALPLGGASVLAVVRPQQSHRLLGRSEAQRITVLLPEPVSSLPYLLPLLLTLLGGALYLLYERRRRFLDRLSRAWARLRGKPAVNAADLPAAAGLSPGLPGVTLNQRGRVAALLTRRVADHGLDGQIVDAAYGKPVAALLSLRDVADESTRAQQADARGAFRIADLPAGSYEVVVHAPGYLPERFMAVLPHRGELRGVRVSLAPIRVAILTCWRRAAGPLLPTASELLTWTPRELFAHARAVGQGVGLPALLALTDLVEESFYSPRESTAEMLAEAERLAAGLAAGLSIEPSADGP